MDALLILTLEDAFLRVLRLMSDMGLGQIEGSHVTMFIPSEEVQGSPFLLWQYRAWQYGDWQHRDRSIPITTHTSADYNDGLNILWYERLVIETRGDIVTIRMFRRRFEEIFPPGHRIDPRTKPPTKPSWWTRLMQRISKRS